MSGLWETRRFISRQRAEKRLSSNIMELCSIREKPHSALIKACEKAMVSEMIALYCRKQHGSKNALCPECAVLDTYARQRSDKCPFMETKTFCSNCKIHCYKPEMRERIRVVMRFSGPRMNIQEKDVIIDITTNV